MMSLPTLQELAAASIDDGLDHDLVRHRLFGKMGGIQCGSRANGYKWELCCAKVSGEL